MKKLTLLAASVLLANAATAATTTPLTLDVYNADGNSFHVNSTLVYGNTEALLIDTGFTKADALRIAAKVIDSGKELKTIFISQADPDYYFGAEVLHGLFPEAEIITTPAVRKVIEEKLAGKVAYWGPKLGNNAPVTPVLPAAYTKNTLTVDGHKVEIHGTEGAIAHRPYLWIPENKAILGNVAIFGNLHLWMADAQSDKSQQAWIKQLKEMQALHPETVIPGHMKSGTKLNTASISYSLQYLQDFQKTKASSKNSDELIDKMSASYPDAQLPIALSIGAKVHMGEMKW
ncbi:MBL fold metallo-hydrolase [Photobacterium kasasachensis]|uniref:MBL fold metallo-hydrolase n=1 Tax=Photobacterium kasasachensis TaxID=2910240 RepID=UPI003D10324E